MEDCACVDFNNRCDEHKDLVIGPNLVGGGSEPWISGEMEALPNGSPLIESERLLFESQNIPETDAMGREKFWEDMGRPNE